MTRSLTIVVVLCASACAIPGARKATGAAEVRLGLARERVASRDWTAVMRALDPLPKRRTQRAAALSLRGVALRERGMFDDAERDFKEASELESKNASAPAGLGILLDMRGMPEAAEPHHRRAVELEPENASYVNDLAFCLYMQGKPADAVPLYQRALRLSPSDRRIRNNLGFALAAAGDFTRAAQQFALGGTAAEAKNNLGYAYELAGNRRQALDLYSQALRLDPKLRTAQANLHALREHDTTQHEGTP